MKFIYSTNIWSHHQSLVASELARILGQQHFRMMLFEEVRAERRKLGWGEAEALSWVIGPPHSPKEMDALVQESADADVMVLGAVPRRVMKARIATGKPTFIAAERLFKKPCYHPRMMFNPRYVLSILRYRLLVNRPHVHALAIGHYAPDDLQKIGAFGDRLRKWAYFVDISDSPPGDPHPQRPLKLLWAGRMLDWKRVDLLLKALAELADSGCIGECLIVGDGPERTRLFALRQKLYLDPATVRFSEPVHFTEVRKLMREADAYVLTSNRHEGWGAVAGEAMGEGCVLVANEQAGAARDLVEHGKTGLLFRDNNPGHLAEQLKRLAGDYSLRMHLRQRAWVQMQDVWHPRVAAERLITLSEGLVGTREIPEYADGPCMKIRRKN